MNEFSFFAGGIKVVAPTATVDLVQVLSWIREGKYAEAVAGIRGHVGNSKAIAFYKKKLDYVTFSGTFQPIREAGKLEMHSGLIVMDFDHQPDPEALKLQFTTDKYVNACFLSPSGAGLKVIVKVKDPERHKQHFQELAYYFNTEYKLGGKEQVDPSGSDVSRACFMSHDPELYYNAESEVFGIQGNMPVPKPRTERQITKDASDLEKWVALIVGRIEASKMSVCNTYNELLLIGFSLAVLEEAGRSYFHRVCAQSEKYEQKVSDEKFDNFLKTSRFTTIAKFVSICMDYGINVSQKKDKEEIKGADVFGEGAGGESGVADPSAAVPLSETKKKKKKTEEEWDSTVWYEEGGMKIKGGKYWDHVAPNFQLFIKYRTEDEQENVTWVLQIKKTDDTELFMEVIHDDFCSARKLKNMLATKRLGFKIKDGHLDELHSYLFTKTSFATAMKVIRYGYHADSKVYFFANKALNLINGEMLTPDEFGIVEANKLHLSIPKQTKLREIRYTLTDQNVPFQKFWDLYAVAHVRENAFLPVCFYIFSLFRDLGLQFKNFSPILFLKGGAGTGKSSMIRTLTAAFGRKQEGINLKSKNTDVGLIKLMSQTSNSIIWFDEFHNDLPNEGLLQAAYDNDGYHKSTTDFNSIDTASVDIYSALALTSNFLPENLIFFSRCLFVPISDQKKSDEQVKAYDSLKELEEGGLGSMTVELLRYRPLLLANNNYGVCYNRLYTALKAKLKGQSVPERFYANMAQIMAAPYFLQCQGKLNLLEIESTNEQEILSEYVELGQGFIMRQARIMNESKAVAEFFEIVQLLFDGHLIHEEFHFRFLGESVLLNFRKLYNLFSQKYRQVFYKSPPDRDTIQTELAILAGKDDWEAISKGIRFANDGSNNSKASTIPQSGSCEVPYKVLQQNFGVDFMNRSGGTN